MFVDLDYANTSVVGNSEFHWESQKTTLKSCAYAQLLRMWLGIVNPSFIKYYWSRSGSLVARVLCFGGRVVGFCIADAGAKMATSHVSIGFATLCCNPQRITFEIWPN
jgi:hypothetical protein